jgi:hypothetical protein
MPEQQIHPMIATELRKLQKQIKALDSENERLSIELQDERKAREAMQRQEVHIDDMPGKQLPFKYQINIDLEGGSQAPVTGTTNVSRDGPFIARRLYASCIVTDAPILDDGNTVEDYSHMIGRFIPLSSRWRYNNWAMDVASFTPDTYVPPALDFEWSYNDGGSERNRQDKPISGDILARHDDDGFLMNNEIFAAGTTISFVCHLLRAVPILAHTSDPDVTGPLDLQLKVTFDGFKVLQPLEM